MVKHYLQIKKIKKTPTLPHWIFKCAELVWFSSTVQPDSPQIVKCEKMGQKMNVTIAPPPTWSSPHSFFSLEHEIEYVLKDNGDVGAF